MPGAGDTWAHTAPGHPHPLRRRPRPAALRLGQGRRERETSRTAPPPESSPGPWRAPLTMLAPLRTPRALHFPRADLNPPSRAPVLRRLRARRSGWVPGVGKTRAGAGAGLTREGRARWRWLACPRGGGKTRPDSPARRQPKAWPGPRDARGGDPGPPPPTAGQPEPRPGPTGPLPAAPCAAPLCPPARSRAGPLPRARTTPPKRAPPAPPLLRLASRSLSVSRAASEEARSAHHLPDPRHVLLGKYYPRWSLSEIVLPRGGNPVNPDAFRNQTI